MNRNAKILVFAACALVATTAVTMAVDPLRRSEQRVHRYLLEQVPVGSTLEDLKAVAANKGWRIQGTWEGRREHADWGGIDGHTIAWVHLGSYRSPFQTSVDSFWAFDENGKLADVVTRRTTDAP